MAETVAQFGPMLILGGLSSVMSGHQPEVRRVADEARR
jgi:hypothetical protein